MSVWSPQTNPPCPPRLFENGAEVEVDLLVEAEVLGHAAAVGPEQERRVRLVDQDAGAVLLGDLDDLGSAQMSPSIE
jgi:hypothetical protein